ncbi:MAG: hypothetical protein WDW38_004238 [Sanguina aurantia]
MDHVKLHDYSFTHATHNGLDSGSSGPDPAPIPNHSHMQQLPPDYLLPSQDQPPNGEAQQYQQQMMELLELLQAERSKSKVLGSQLSRMTGAQSHLQSELTQTRQSHAKLLHQLEVQQGETERWHTSTAQLNARITELATRNQELATANAELSTRNAELLAGAAAVAAASAQEASTPTELHTQGGSAATEAAAAAAAAAATPPAASKLPHNRAQARGEERSALRLQKAEYALEQEQQAVASLRRQLSQARLQRTPAPDGNTRPTDAASNAGAGGGDLRSGEAAASDADVQASEQTTALLTPLQPRLPPATAHPMCHPTRSNRGSIPPVLPLQRAAPTHTAQLREKLHRTCALLSQREAELQTRLVAQARAEEGMERLRTQVTNLLAAGKPPAPGQGLVEDLLAARREKQAMAAELSKRGAMEESWKVQLRAADDKAGAAGHVALDLQRQCEAAAATIGRLIGENSELMGKINLQANKMSELKQVVSKRDIGIRALEAMLATARPHSALHSQPSLPRDSSPAAADNSGHFSAHGRSSSGGGGPGSPEGHVPHVRFADQHGPAAPSAAGESGAQGEAYFGGLTEAEWKLVMLAALQRQHIDRIQQTRACNHITSSSSSSMRLVCRPSPTQGRGLLGTLAPRVSRPACHSQPGAQQDRPAAQAHPNLVSHINHLTQVASHHPAQHQTVEHLPTSVGWTGQLWHQPPLICTPPDSHPSPETTPTFPIQLPPGQLWALPVLQPGSAMDPETGQPTAVMLQLLDQLRISGPQGALSARIQDIAVLMTSLEELLQAEDPGSFAATAAAAAAAAATAAAAAGGGGGGAGGSSEAPGVSQEGQGGVSIVIPSAMGGVPTDGGEAGAHGGKRQKQELVHGTGKAGTQKAAPQQQVLMQRGGDLESGGARVKGAGRKKRGWLGWLSGAPRS